MEETDNQKKSGYSTRNYSIDVLKFILAVMVVFLHAKSYYKDFLQPITTCAVPTFFMISGWLIFGRDVNSQKMVKNAWRITKIFLWSFLLYQIVFFIRHSEFWIPKLKDFLLFVLSNNEGASGHLWYLSSYAYVLFIVALLALIKKLKYLPYLALFAFALYMICDCYFMQSGLEKKLTIVYSFRNFFFTGLPFFTLGAYIRRKDIVLTNKQNIINFILLVSLSILALLEINYLHLNHIADVYFFTLPLSVSLFLIFVSTVRKERSIISDWGGQISLYIYIFHPLFNVILKSAEGDNPAPIFMLTNPLIVLTLSMILSMVYVYSKNKVQKVLSNNK